MMIVNNLMKETVCWNQDDSDCVWIVDDDVDDVGVLTDARYFQPQTAEHEGEESEEEVEE